MIYLENYRKRIGKVVKSYDKWMVDMENSLSDNRLSQVAWNDFDKLFDSYRKMLGPNKDLGKILDFGCGNGLLLDFLKENGYSYQYLGVDIRKEVIEEARSIHPNEEFSSIQKIEDVPQDKYDLVFAHGVFTTQMDEKDILEFVDYFSDSNRIIFSFIRTNSKRVISKKKDIYTFYNSRNLKMYLSKNIEFGNFRLNVLNDTDDIITWENTSMVNEGFLSNVTTAVMLAGLSVLYSCGISAPKEDTMKQIEKYYHLEKSDIGDIKSCKDQIKLMVNTSDDIDQTLKINIINKIDQIPFFVCDDVKRFGKEASSANAFYVSIPIQGKMNHLVVIRKGFLEKNNSKEVSRAIIHELSHYVDALDKNKNDWDKLVDQDLTSKEKVAEKIDSLFAGNPELKDIKVSVPQKYQEIINLLSTRYSKKHYYYTSATEMYVRGINFKMWLLEKKAIQDINEPIKMDHILLFQKKLDQENLVDVDFFSFIVFLNFDKLK